MESVRLITFEPYNKAQTWYVIFEKPRSRGFRWWRLFTGNRFAHCWMITQAGEGIIYYEPLHWGMCCHYDETTLDHALTELAASDITALVSVTIDYRLCHEYQWRGLYSCVSQVKAALGLRKCYFTLTPFQLYKRLCKNDKAIVIKPFVPYVRR